MSAKIELKNLGKKISEIVEEYGDEVYEAVEDGLDSAEKELLNNLKSKSPEDTGDYKKRWRSKGRKYKLKRYVHNTKTVKNADGDSIPLSNILEYSEASKHQGLIRKTFEESESEMINAFEETLKGKI